MGAAGMTLSRAVKLHQIQCIVAAARQGSFRRAAAALNMRQSSVSRSVQELEAHLGAPLFTRGAGGVAQTEVGERFLADAELALGQLSRAAEMAGAAGEDERNTLRIGSVPIPGSGPLPDLLQAFTATWPEHRLVLHEAPSADILVALHAGALDLAVVLAPPRGGLGAEAWPLWREPLMLAVSARAADSGGETLAWGQVDPAGLILPAGEIGDLIAARLTALFGDRFSGAACRASPETVLRLVAMGQGRAIVTSGACTLAPDGVRFRLIADTALPVSAVRMARNEKLPLRRLMILARRTATPCDGGGGASQAGAGGGSPRPRRLHVVG
jgi:DNA-binding transcriptional LysR family regulator